MHTTSYAPAISRRDIGFIKAALRAAAKSQGPNKFKLGAVAVKSGRVLSKGSNSTRNVPRDWMPREAWSTHAEEACLKNIGESAAGGTLYVARLNKNGQARMSKPCEACTEVATNAGITRVVYTTNNGIAAITL